MRFPAAVLLFVLLLLVVPVRAVEPFSPAVFVRHLSRADLAGLVSTPPARIRFLELGVARRPSSAEARREGKRLQFLLDLFRAEAIALNLLVVRLDRFEADRTARAPETVLGALSGDGIRFALDLRTPDPPPAPYGPLQRRLDDQLLRLPDFFLIVPAGDAGRDDDGDGVADPGTAGGELAALKNALCIGAAEDLAPELAEFWTGFSAPPLSQDRVADSPNGLAADSGRGLPDNGIPSCVLAATAQSDGRGQLRRGTHYAAIRALLAAARSDAFLRQRFALPETGRMLLRSFLLCRTENLDPGQFGRGPWREIHGCPDSGQGFGRLDDPGLPVPPGVWQIYPERVGRMAGTAWRRPLPAVKRPTRAVAQLAVDEPGGREILNDLDLEIRRADGSVTLPERRSPGRSDERVEFTLHPGVKSELIVRCRRGAAFRTPFAVSVRLRQTPDRQQPVER